MSKEYLEAFKNLKQELYYSPNQIPDVDKWHETIEQALQRLESIDNAEPSEALECLEKTISPLLEPILAEYEDDLSDKITANYFALKQTLIKSQRQEEDIIHYKGTIANLRRDNALLKELNAEYKKVLDIIKEKRVNIEYLRQSHNVREYNSKITVIIDGIKYAKSEARKLTEEEFKLLKRYFEKIFKIGS